MVRSRSIVTLFVAVALGAPAMGQEVDLKWKFEKGKTFYQEVTSVTQTNIDLTGTKTDQTQTQTFIYGFTPKAFSGKERGWTIEQKVEAVKMSFQLGIFPIKFHSTEAFKGTKCTLTIDKDMNVSGEDSLKQISYPAFSMVPGKPVKKGDSWERKTIVNMGPIGQCEDTSKYTYQGTDEKDKNLAKIAVAPLLKYIPPDPKAESGLPFRIIKAALKYKDPSGSIIFDTAKNRVASSTSTSRLEGTLTIEIGGMESNVKLSQTQTTTVKTSDECPTEKPSRTSKAGGAVFEATVTPTGTTR